MMTRRVAVLGSTGSIGTQAIEVASREVEHMQVVALAAGRDVDRLVEQARAVQPEVIAIEFPPDETAVSRLAQVAPNARIESGAGAAVRLVEQVDADTVLNGIVGAAGLRASLATLERKLRLALANKETLVVGGELVREALARGGEIIPVDSEHSALLQCIGGRPPEDVAAMILTASGGALREHPDWRHATREDVLAHPVWSMGNRITVDSATLFNKGLELIEARWLFDVPWERLAAWVHPETIVHCIVTFTDGSSVLQAAAPDMHLPIQLGISWPDRWGQSIPMLAPDDLAGLHFAPVEVGAHPAFDIACAAGRAGGTAPCVLNAADEVAVAGFLEGAIELGALPDILARVLDAHDVERTPSLEQLERVDAWAREKAQSLVHAAAGGPT